MSSTRSPLYTVKKSKVPIDLVLFDNYDHLKDPGLGLFQNFDGEKKIKFLCPNGTIEVIPCEADKIILDDQQHRYGVDSAMEDHMIICPTKKSINDCKIALAFRVQHNSDDPTHRLMWVFDTMGRDYPHSYPQLVPRRPLKKGDEVTFNYKFRYSTR